VRWPRHLRTLGVEVLVVTHPAAAPLRAPCPMLVVVHDVIPLRQPRDYSLAKRLYYRTVVRWSLRGAARVLADSESTARDCERLLGVPRERLRAVYAGVGEEFTPAAAAMNGAGGRPYFLYLGNKRPHKNVDRLLEAYALLLREGDPGCDLVIAGRDEPGDVETDGRPLRALADRLGLDGRVRFAGEVASDALPALYANARALAYLSSYEGFGLPALEAMACGTPVLALNASSLPEVVGKGGLLVESAEPALVAERLRALATDGALRDRLARNALQQAAKFSWRATARAFAEEIDAALRRTP
jgi:glycosyltransferase involved in cell wall biosynthesis